MENESTNNPNIGNNTDNNIGANDSINNSIVDNNNVGNSSNNSEVEKEDSRGIENEKENKTVSVKKENGESSKAYYEKLGGVYNGLDIEKVLEERKSIFSNEDSEVKPPEEDINKNTESSKGLGSERKVPEAKEKTALADIIDPKTGVILVDNVMSSVSSSIYNFFAKDHQCSPQDWSLSQAQMNGLYPVTKQLMEHIKVDFNNPYLAFAGVLAGMYMAKAGEVRSHYKKGTKIRPEADTNKVKGGVKKSSEKVRKYIGQVKDKNPNPDHQYWKENPQEFEQMKSAYELNKS